MSETLTLEYNLAELPSSQHRAGLAGLVLMVRWLTKEPDKKGICEITQIDETSATLQIDLEGLQFLFDKVFSSSVRKMETAFSSLQLLQPLQLTNHQRSGLKCVKTKY